jgi:carbonic anhydrase
MAITKEFQEKTSPDQVVDLLKEGNERFINGNIKNYNVNDLIEMTKTGQNPTSAILACMDSRVPVEKVFDQTIGEVFSFRSPGNVVNEDIIGGMEYAAVVAGTKLFAVIGHTGCGAVNAAVDGTELGNLTPALKRIGNVANNLSSEGLARLEYVNKVIDGNVLNSIESIRKQSPILKEKEDKGEIKIVGGVYDIASGKVTFY